MEICERYEIDFSGTLVFSRVLFYSKAKFQKYNFLTVLKVRTMMVSKYKKI